MSSSENTPNPMFRPIVGEFRERLESLPLKILELSALLATLSDEPHSKDVNELLCQLAKADSIDHNYKCYLACLQGSSMGGGVLDSIDESVEYSDQFSPDFRPTVAQRMAKRVREVYLDYELEADSPAIVEISCLTGDEDAGLFVEDLLEMYSTFANNKKWKLTLIDFKRAESRGLESLRFSVEGRRAWGTLRFESGMHRVTRVPVYEIQNRNSNSGILVKVYKSQVVGKQIKRLPEQADAESLSGEGDSGSPSSHPVIRTYNFAQDRFTDLRLKEKSFNLNQIIKGGLAEFCDCLGEQDYIKRTIDMNL